MTAQPEAEIVAKDHVVQFYDVETDVIQHVSEYLLAGLRAGDTVVVVATQRHRRGFEARIVAEGVDLAEARRQGRYLTLDASAVQEAVATHGRCLPDGFEQVIGTTVRKAAESGRAIRVFGEVVALLWDAGHIVAAIELEALWNKLGSDLAFSLYCAYPNNAVSGRDNTPALRAICRLHSTVLRPRVAAPIAGVARTHRDARFASLRDEFMGGFRHNTARAYTSDLADILDWAVARGSDMVQLTATDIERYGIELQARRYTLNTVNRKRTALRGFYALAIAKGFRTDSPMSGWPWLRR